MATEDHTTEKRSTSEEFDVAITSMTEATYTLTTDEVDEINLILVEALAMADVLEAAGTGGHLEMKHLGNYASLLQEKIEAAYKSFDRATSKGEKAA
jgi:hypothetical protein